MSLKKTTQVTKEKGYEILIASEITKQITVGELLKNQNICLFIGPEGGFSDQEFDFFLKNKLKMFSLGNHVIRAETAAIAATSQVINCLLQNNKNYY
jgi:16S rRNA (uracil1498-N3)-methyltransferase